MKRNDHPEKPAKVLTPFESKCHNAQVYILQDTWYICLDCGMPCQLSDKDILVAKGVIKY